jgi:hypothetical protein
MVLVALLAVDIELLEEVLFSEAELLVDTASTGTDADVLVERDIEDESVAFMDKLYVELADAVVFMDIELMMELDDMLKNGAEVTVAFKDWLAVALAMAVVFMNIELIVELDETLKNGAEVMVALSELLAVALDTDVAFMLRLVEVIETFANGAVGRVVLVELLGGITGNFGGNVLVHSVRLLMLFTPSKLSLMYAWAKSWDG